MTSQEVVGARGLLQQLADSFGQVFVVLGPDGAVRFASEGAPSQGSVGHAVLLAALPSLRDELGADKEQVRRYVPPLGMVHARRWPDGEGCLALRLDNDDESLLGGSLEVALRASRMGLWHWSAATDKVTWDDRMREITGEPEPLGLAEWVEELTHPDDRAQVLAAGVGFPPPGPVPSSASRIVRRSDGEVRWVLSVSTVYGTPDGRALEWVGGVLDVTDQYELQAELEAARRTQAVADLTTGVAHHVNNMLMVVDPALRMLQEVADDDMSPVVSDAVASCERAADVVRHLMAFGMRGARQERGMHSAMRLVQRVASAARVRIRPEVRFEVVGESHARVSCAGGAIEHVLLSLLDNASHAVRHTQRQREPVLRLVVGDQPDDGWVHLTVEDSGPGVPDDLLERIYEPFFTTKGSRGSGLGLASSTAIVRDHGGRLTHTRSLLGGAAFRVSLPAHAFEAQAVGPVEVDDDEPQAEMKVLVIDDERAILRVLARGLPRRGAFVVTTAASAEEALDVIATDEEFDAILLDRSLGFTDGSDLIADLRSRWPGATLAFFTGQPLSPEEQDAVDLAIYKPVAITELAERLREVV